MLVSRWEAYAAASSKAAQAFAVDSVPRLGNVAATDLLNATVRFWFRGRAYDVPPVPFAPGIRLQQAELELARVAAMEDAGTLQEGLQALRDLRDALATAADVVWRHSRPAGLLGRIRARLTRHNPFLQASRQELAEILGFFSQCRMLSGVRLISVK